MTSSQKKERFSLVRNEINFDWLRNDWQWCSFTLITVKNICVFPQNLLDCILNLFKKNDWINFSSNTHIAPLEFKFQFLTLPFLSFRSYTCVLNNHKYFCLSFHSYITAILHMRNFSFIFFYTFIFCLYFCEFFA